MYVLADLNLFVSHFWKNHQLRLLFCLKWHFGIGNMNAML